MKSFRRTGATTVATMFGLSIGITLANAVAPNWTHRVGIDVWNLPSAVEEGRVANDEMIVLDKKEQRLLWEIEVSEHLATELVNGTMSLREAVDEMEPLLCKRTGFLECLYANYQTHSLRLGVARYLINRISSLDRFETDRQNDALSRLECEFTQLNEV